VSPAWDLNALGEEVGVLREEPGVRSSKAIPFCKMDLTTARSRAELQPEFEAFTGSGCSCSAISRRS
jgi:hypothetical protein